MAVCSFIGHEEIYDADMKSRMQAAVDRLAAEHGAIEFLIYPGGMSSYAFLLEALRARTQYPQKVTITFVSYCNSVSTGRGRELACSYICDRVITLNMQEAKSGDPRIGYKRMLRWISQNSTHLISYLYDTLYDPANHPAKGLNGPEVIDLTTRETEAAIWEAISRITEKERSIFHKLSEGCTLKEAGASIGTGGERARQLMRHGCRAIRFELSQRYNRAITAEQRSGLHTCGLFALGDASYDALTRFKYIMELLTLEYLAKDIYVQQSYASSGFLFALSSSGLLNTSYQNLHITALIGASSSDKRSDPDPNAVRDMLCPPCHAIEYVGRADSGNSTDDFDVISDMIERMDFCICNLSATPYAERIKRYAAQTRCSVLLDIGRFQGGADNRYGCRS